MKKVFVMVLFFLLIAGVCMAQDVTKTSQPTVMTAQENSSPYGDFKVGFLAMGQDNIYAWTPGGGAFIAVGGGIDIASWEKSIGSKGGKLNLILHGTAAAKVTGNDSSALVGTSINIDLIKLLNGTGIKFLLDNFKCVLGPVVLFDANMGKMAYGGLLNFSYTITK